MNKDTSAGKLQSYKDYCQKESDQAYDTILKNQEEYDRQFLTLSTGLLAVLVAFLKDVVHLESAVLLSLLYLGLIDMMPVRRALLSSQPYLAQSQSTTENGRARLQPCHHSFVPSRGFSR